MTYCLLGRHSTTELPRQLNGWVESKQYKNICNIYLILQGYMQYIFNIARIYAIYVFNIARIYVIYAYIFNIARIYAIYAKYIFNIARIYVIYMQYCKDICNICTIYLILQGLYVMHVFVVGKQVYKGTRRTRGEIYYVRIYIFSVYFM